jgi:hypothetical protein
MRDIHNAPLTAARCFFARPFFLDGQAIAGSRRTPP